MNNPTFAPGQTAWHVRHGKVTLVPTNSLVYPVSATKDWRTTDGKSEPQDVGRVLYTLAEAEQYGWYKPEPLRVEFDSYVVEDSCLAATLRHSEDLIPLIGKRVRVTVEEVKE
jgi:hypothetical protein